MWLVSKDEVVEDPFTNANIHSDPIPFQWLARDRQLCQNAKFIDIDYEALIMTKRDIIQATPKMRELLTKCSDTNRDPSILLNTEEYAAVGCDLRNTKRLERLLRSVAELDDCLVLCVAEVSITYMHTDAADALIAWATTLSPGTYHDDKVRVTREADCGRCHILLAGTEIT